jgi:adhesin transport system membrane fusion protein
MGHEIKLFRHCRGKKMTNTDNHNDLDFMSEIDAAKRLKPHGSSTLLLWVIISLIAFVFIWAALSEIEVITRGQGQVVPSSETQLVQSLEGGILAELNVTEGDSVTKGDILARIDNVAFASEERGIEAQILALKLKRARLNAEIQGQNFNVPNDMRGNLADNEIKLYQSRQKVLKNTKAIASEAVAKAQANIREINATINRLSESRRLLKKQLDMTRNLVSKNAMPEVEALTLEREYADVQGNLNAAVQRKRALESDLSSARKQGEEVSNKFRSEALGEMSDVETRLSAIQESLTAAGDRVARTELRAPADGIIKTINQKTIGGIVEPAMRLIEIVPIEDDLKITAKVNPADIAFIKVGQDANVKITAYDPQKFGSLKGRLARISADTVEDREGNIFFEIDVITDRNYLGTSGQPLPIIPGMVAETEIITGKRTILSYMLKPFSRARDRALTER